VRKISLFWLAVGVALLLCAPAEARSVFAPKPDLKVTVFEVHLGTPAYAVVAPGGVLEPIEVHIVTKNQGTAAAGPSVTDVFFQDSAHQQFQKRIAVPALKAHTRFDRTIELTGAKPALGYAQLGAVADLLDQVKESDETNNLLKAGHFAIVAKQWNVSSFDTITKGFLSNDTTFVKGGFHFVLAYYDHTAEEWYYKPYGAVTDQASERGTCSFSSNKSLDHNPWANSYLKIKGDLGGYQALVAPAASEAYTITINCLGIGSHVEKHAFQPLETYEGFKREPTMASDQAELADSMKEDGTTWAWDFKAAL
jgi:hypothetical protein